MLRQKSKTLKDLLPDDSNVLDESMMVSVLVTKPTRSLTSPLSRSGSHEDEDQDHHHHHHHQPQHTSELAMTEQTSPADFDMDPFPPGNLLHISGSIQEAFSVLDPEGRGSVPIKSISFVLEKVVQHKRPSSHQPLDPVFLSEIQRELNELAEASNSTNIDLTKPDFFNVIVRAINETVFLGEAKFGVASTAEWDPEHSLEEIIRRASQTRSRSQASSSGSEVEDVQQQQEHPPLSAQARTLLPRSNHTAEEGCSAFSDRDTAVRKWTYPATGFEECVL